MRRDYRVTVVSEAGEAIQDGTFPKRWYAERVFRVVKLKPRQTAELWRWSRWRGDWKLIEERP